MEQSVLMQIKKFIQPEFIQGLSMNSSDSEERIEKAYQATIPTLWMQLDEKSDYGLREMLEKAQNIFSNDAENMHTKLSLFPSLVQDLGFDYATLKNRVSNYANISDITSDSVIKTSIWGILNYFRELTPDFDFSIVKNFISSKLPEMKSYLPLSFSTSDEPSASHTSFAAKTEDKNEEIHVVVNENEKDQFKTNESPYSSPNTSGGGGWKWSILLIVLAIIAYFLYKSCNDNAENTTVVKPVNDSLVVEDTTNFESRERTQLQINDETELSVYKGGIEEQLIAFLESGDYQSMSKDQLKDIWFDFDHLNFETGSNRITADTRFQLDNIAAIMKQYPNAKIKIGGYTDKTGDEELNKKLSTDRAKAVERYLTEKGVGSQIDGAEGYGSEFAKYAIDASEEERMLDRRVSLSVRN